MRITIYTGVFNINSLGATKTLFLPLIPFLIEAGVHVKWAGIGELYGPELIIDLEKKEIFVFWKRFKTKVKMKFFHYNLQREVLKQYRSVDKKLARKISRGDIKFNNNEWFIGLTAMSNLSFKAAKKRGAKILLSMIWMHPFTQKKILEEQFNKLGIKITPILDERVDRQLSEIELSDKIWCVSNLVKESMIENNVPEEKLFSLPLGVDYKKYYSNSLLRKNNTRFTILFVGNVGPEKGVHILMESLLLSEVQNIDLVFNGGVPDYFKPIFNSYTKKLEHQKINVRVEPGDTMYNYRNASLFVLPSVHEAFGFSVIEAMASGLPVIVSDNVGSKECITDSEMGLIFKSENIEQLANAIKSFYADEKLCYETGLRAQLHVKKYDWKNIGSDLMGKINSF